jgi:hypothetical protein
VQVFPGTAFKSTRASGRRVPKIIEDNDVNEDRYIIDWCKYCNQGWVEILKTTKNEFIIMCDEDYLAFASPYNYFHDINGFRYFDGSSEIMKNEIPAGWSKYILSEDEIKNASPIEREERRKQLAERNS